MPDHSPTHDVSGSPRSSAPRISAPLVAALHERYEIVRETGQGASATVYLARDLKHDRLVAIKSLKPEMGTTAGERFLREIQVSAGMQHPHILPTYDSGIADGRLYFVMPFVDGGSLRQRLDAEPQLAITEALRIAHDVAVAIAFAHEQGVVHRDIKPENILFYHGHACLADFGVARVMEQLEPRVTGHGMVVGTPAYMSPEQLQDGGFDGRSDVYSLACVLYEMIAGVNAFSGSTPQELLRQRLRRTSEPLHKHRPDAPQFVEDLLIRALAPSPHDRFNDARDFAEAIDFARRDLANPRRTSAPRRALDSVPRHPLLWVGAAAVLLAGGVLAASPLRNAVAGRTDGAPQSAHGAYATGVAALERWDLVAADSDLSRAATAEPANAPAQLRLARAIQLQRGVSTDRFRVVSARLAALRNQLHGRDSLYAEATIALGEGAYQRACAQYDRLRSSDSLDALAWYGLGDCQSLDSAVVRDTKSSSGWSFRTSWPAAAHAYMRAATLDPQSHRGLPYATLAGLLPTGSMQLRFGRGPGDDRPTFGAHPSLLGDTVAYVPHSLADIGGAKGVLSPTLPDVLRRNRDVLVSFARQWVAAAPKNPDAYEALAAGNEARGDIGLDEQGAGSALARARALSRSPVQSLRLATIAVRLAVKRSDFAGARALADSLLSAWPGVVSAADAGRLSGLAAFTGRVDRMAALRAIATNAPNADIGIAPALTETSSRLFARAASGICDDSLLALRRQIDVLLDSYSQPSRRDVIRRELLTRPMILAFRCVGDKAFAGLTPATPIERAQRAAAAHDVRRVRAILDSLDDVRRVGLPGDVALDNTVTEAALRAAVGDTASAVRQLERVLNAFPTLSVWAVREDAQAAAIPLALTLRAELAARSGDAAEARRRAGQALVLLEHADGSLAPSIARLRTLASSAK
ncbi:MAG: protein kinase [Gemmatimonadetes bacterium]|nr:protein kinase [Gemmatimonadota bacterium]